MQVSNVHAAPAHYSCVAVFCATNIIFRLLVEDSFYNSRKSVLTLLTYGPSTSTLVGMTRICSVPPIISQKP